PREAVGRGALGTRAVLPLRLVERETVGVRITKRNELAHERLLVRLRSEEQLQDEDAPIRIALVLVAREPGRDGGTTRSSDGVERLVRPVPLADAPLLREPGSHEAAQDGIELCLRRLPDEADRPIDDLAQVVARDRLVQMPEQAEDRVLGQRQLDGRSLA